MANVGSTIRLATQAVPDCGFIPGDLLNGRFRLAAVAGWGGQAVVFQASDLRRNQATVAVKIARRDLPEPARSEAAAVLKWEGGLLRRLRHQHLPRLYQLTATAAATWLARDLVPGEALLALARRNPLDERRVRELAAQLCDLLSYLHSRATPVVCGDLKPANLIVRPDGSPALIDLGAAQTITRRPPRTPRPRHGTPGYAPPEQLGSWGADERADLFSLAVTCYELLTGLDPTLAPLQFDLARLDRVAPRLAPALRWALELDRERRCPNAATLRAYLGAPLPPPVLQLSFGVSLRDSRDLNTVMLRHPTLLAPVVQGGDLEAWLAQHPDPTLGRLRYNVRMVRAAAPARRTPLDLLLTAMAPPEGSPLIVPDPDHLQLGPVPLRSWRIWSRPQPLTLHNQAMSPLAWELEAPQQSGVDLRFMIDGRPLRKSSGVLAPGARIQIGIVAHAIAGDHHGTLRLHCGTHTRPITWQAAAQPGVHVGDRLVARLEDLDLERADLVAALEQLLSDGSLIRWLRVTGRRRQAGELDHALRRKPNEIERRILVSRLLHDLLRSAFHCCACQT
ncbi:MAG: serine/threonine protein kinase [Oscillochloris sp.]|nr:serine/threonine protein kinase [Oscillochloris sp.]